MDQHTGVCSFRFVKEFEGDLLVAVSDLAGNRSTYAEGAYILDKTAPERDMDKNYLDDTQTSYTVALSNIVDIGGADIWRKLDPTDPIPAGYAFNPIVYGVANDNQCAGFAQV